jgi:hypothetical protein
MRNISQQNCIHGRLALACNFNLNRSQNPHAHWHEDFFVSGRKQVKAKKSLPYTHFTERR